MSEDFEVNQTVSRAYTDDEMAGWWDVTRVGTWKGTKGGKPFDVEVTAEKLATIVADYSPEIHYAPVTTDHLQEGSALGYVSQVRVMDDVLQAKVSWSEWGSYAVQSRSFVNRSAEIADPFDHTGGAYLTGFTFLGAGKPAAKGLSPTPSLMKDGQSVITVPSGTMKLSEVPQMDDKTLKEKIVAWLKAGELGTTTENKETDTVELKEAMNKNAELSESVTALKADMDKLKAVNEKLTAELAESKAASDKAERTALIDRFTVGLSAMVEGEKIVPAEKDMALKLAENVPTDKLGDHITDMEKLYSTRKLNLFTETTKPDQKVTAMSRTAGLRARAAASHDGPDQHMLACADLMDADESLTFEAAGKLIYAAQG